MWRLLVILKRFIEKWYETFHVKPGLIYFPHLEDMRRLTARCLNREKKTWAVILWFFDWKDKHIEELQFLGHVRVIQFSRQVNHLKFGYRPPFHVWWLVIYTTCDSSLIITGDLPVHACFLLVLGRSSFQQERSSPGLHSLLTQTTLASIYPATIKVSTEFCWTVSKILGQTLSKSSLRLSNPIAIEYNCILVAFEWNPNIEDWHPRTEIEKDPLSEIVNFRRTSWKVLHQTL